MYRPGDRIDAWIVDGVLGRGGMGAVYRCHQADLPDIKAAVKVLLLEAPEGSESRFAREAAVLARLSHPAIVTFRQISLTHRPPFLVMDLVEGTSLDQQLDQGPVPLARVIELGLALAGALQHTHEQGVCHRDVKPANVILGDDGRSKLVDFGIALEEDGVALTRTGMVPGSAPYAPPEIFHDDDLDPKRWDVYGLGVTLFEALTGQQAFDGGSGSLERQLARIVMAKHGHQPLDPGQGVPGPMRELIQDMTTSDPDDRIQAMSEVARRLRRVQRQLGAAPEANPTLSPSHTHDLAPERRVISTLAPRSEAPRQQPPPPTASDTGAVSWPPRPSWHLPSAGALALLGLGGLGWTLISDRNPQTRVDVQTDEPAVRTVEVQVSGPPADLEVRVSLGGVAPTRQAGGVATFEGVPLGTARMVAATGAPCHVPDCPGQGCPEACLHTEQQVHVVEGQDTLRVATELVLPTPRPVTRGEFARWVGGNPDWAPAAARGSSRAGGSYLKDWHHGRPRAEDREAPVVWVSGHAAQAYCADRGGLLGPEDPPRSWTEVRGANTHWEWRSEDQMLLAHHSNGDAHAPHGGDRSTGSTGGFRCAWPWPSDGEQEPADHREEPAEEHDDH